MRQEEVWRSESGSGSGSGRREEGEGEAVERNNGKRKGENSGLKLFRMEERIWEA